MAFKKEGLADYVEVPDRIRQFKEAFPDGSLCRVGEVEIKELGSQQFLIYTAAAYRTPDDPRPGIGTAWEPFPGKTPYTKDSELMNAETSAWGRALVALGFVGKKVASMEEVRNRQQATKQNVPDFYEFVRTALRAKDQRLWKDAAWNESIAEAKRAGEDELKEFGKKLLEQYKEIGGDPDDLRERYRVLKAAA